MTPSSSLHEPRVPTTLYHYTSGYGLLGIVKTMSLWATQIAYMNDSEEFIAARNWAVASLQGLQGIRREATYQSLCLHLERCIESIDASDFFVVCFSESDDALSQWRGYCPASFGYSIGFSMTTLDALAGKQNFYLRRCHYENSSDRYSIIYKWMESVVEDLLQNYNSMLASSDISAESFVSNKKGSIVDSFVKFIPYIKDSSFKEEREWRLVCFGKDASNVDIRIGKLMLVPYRVFDIAVPRGLSSISSVRVGPNPKMKLALDSVHELMQMKHLAANVLATQLPYRDW